MAALKIFRPPVCGDPASEVPRSLWPELVGERANFCRSVLPRDCRLLLFFIEDAEQSEWMGYGNREKYLSDGLQLKPEMVALAVRGLEISDPEKALAFDRAVVLGKADQEDRESQRPRGRPENVDTPKIDVNISPRPDGNNRKNALRRLRKDRPAIHARVLAGELSPNAGMIEAGFRKRAPSRKLTALAKIKKLLPSLTSAERKELKAML